MLRGGNRTSRNSTLPGIPTAFYAFYAYNAKDQLAADAYDANGNTIASGANTYSYNFENRLKSVNGGQITIVYDGEGNRTA